MKLKVIILSGFAFSTQAWSDESSSSDTLPITVADQSQIAENFARLQEYETAQRREGTEGTGSVATLKQPALIFSANEESSKATLSAGFTLGSPKPDTQGRLGYKSLQLQVQTPLDKKAEDKRTNIARLDDISNGTTLGLTFRSTKIGGFNDYSKCRLNRVEEVVAAICSRDTASLKVDSKVCKAIKDRATGKSVPAELRQDMVDAINKIRSAPKYKSEITDADRQFSCNPVTDSSGSYVSYGIKAQLGFDEFSVLDTASFDESTTDENPFSVSAFWLYAPKGSNLTTYVAGLQYKDGFKASESKTICQPADAVGLQECKTGAISGPIEDDDLTVFGELRQGLWFSAGGARYNFAIQPRLAFDFEDNDYGIDVPIYLVPGKDEQLTGGLRLGWDSDSNGVSLGLFFGATFDLFGDVE
jgi:hypothetical protein